MSGGLERELARLLREPCASERIEQQALGLALAALPPRDARRPRMLTLAAAAALVLLAIAAGALAAVGTLRVSLGDGQRQPRSAPVDPVLRVPGGTRAVAVVVDHRLWLTTRSGLRIVGLPVGSAALSPHALYVAAGLGSSLVAMAPSGARAWSHPAGGRVVAIAWAPDGLRIAYVVERRGTFQLRAIEGNGERDRLLDRSVRPVMPSWWSDSLAVAYVGAGGRPVVYDLGHDAHRVLPHVPDGVSRIAFAPEGTALAVACPRAVVLVDAQRPAQAALVVRGRAAALTWASGQLAIGFSSHTGSVVRVFSVRQGGRVVASGALVLPGRLRALDGGAGELVAAVDRPGAPARVLGSRVSVGRKVLLELPSGAGIEAVFVR